MPEEGSLFQEVDAVYKRLMLSILRDPLVLNCAGAQGVLEVLIEQTQSLEKINDGVNNYLEKKRLYFPRFFFLSNDEMLEILSETKDPLRVQPHLRKCFEGIAKLGFDHELNIYSMISAEGEQIMIVSTISTEEARGAVEKWLLQVNFDERRLLTCFSVIGNNREITAGGRTNASDGSRGRRKGVQGLFVNGQNNLGERMARSGGNMRVHDILDSGSSRTTQQG